MPEPVPELVVRGVSFVDDDPNRPPSSAKLDDELNTIVLTVNDLVDFVRQAIADDGRIKLLSLPPEAGGAGVADGDKGHIIVSAGGTVWLLDANSVTANELANNAVNYDKLLDGAVAYPKIADGAVFGSKLADAGIALAKLAAIPANTLLGNNLGAVGTPAALTVAQVKTLLALSSADLSDFATAVAATPAVAANTAKVTNQTHTGDVTGATALTLATVNATTGSFGLAASVAQFVVNAKGLVTSAVNVPIAIAAAAITDATAAGRAFLTAATVAAQTALLDVFTGTLKGLTPASGGGTTNFLRADGVWAAPPAGGAGVTDGDKGDITVTASGATWTIDPAAVTLAKLADVASGTVFYRKTAGAGAPEVQTLATLKTDLGLTGTNGGDQTTIVGITGTKAQFDAAVTDGNFLYVGDAPTAHTHTLAAGATDVTITAANLNALDDGVDTTLHFHAADRARANHTGTQLANTISDFAAAADARIGAASVNALADVVITAPSTGQVIKWNGTNWINDTDATAAGGGSGDVVGPASAADNAVARFDLTTGKLIQNSLVSITDQGHVNLPAAANPSAPPAGIMRLFSTLIGSKEQLGFMGPDGDVHALQSHLGEFNVARFQPAAGSATLVGHGLAISAAGTATLAQNAITNLHSMLARVEALVTAAATTAVAGLRGSNAAFRVGRDANAPGGFLARIIWGPATGNVATSRAFAGMRTNSSPTDVEPSSLFNLIGMGWDAADTNIQLMHNDNSGVATKIDLGASFPVPTVDRSEVYEIQLYSPNSLTQSVNYRVIRYNTTAKTIAAEVTGTITTNLPLVSQLLAPQVHMSVGGTSSVVGVALMGFYVQTE